MGSHLSFTCHHHNLKRRWSTLINSGVSLLGGWGFLDRIVLTFWWIAGRLNYFEIKIKVKKCSNISSWHIFSATALAARHRLTRLLHTLPFVPYSTRELAAIPSNLEFQIYTLGAGGSEPISQIYTLCCSQILGGWGSEPNSSPQQSQHFRLGLMKAYQAPSRQLERVNFLVTHASVAGWCVYMPCML